MRLRRRAIIFAGLLLLTLSVSSQNRTSGQVRNRDGGPEPKCQIDFFWNQGPELTYRVYSDHDGFFFLNDPNRGCVRGKCDAREQVPPNQGRVH